MSWISDRVRQLEALTRQRGRGAVEARELRAGERYRLGLGFVRGDWGKDDWTGRVVRLVSPISREGYEGWLCDRLDGAELDAAQMSVSEERLRAAAFLGKD